MLDELMTPPAVAAEVLAGPPVDPLRRLVNTLLGLFVPILTTPVELLVDQGDN